MQAISFVARRGAGMAEHGLFLESLEASSFLVLGNQDISINMARHSVAGYVRSGNDLILNLSDGREIVLENYFGATGSDANRLFLSSNGLIEQVAFEFGPDGSVYPMYQGAESWGKWGPSQDLVFYEEPSPIGIADAATGYEDETVSMLGTAMALGPGLALGGGSVAAVLGTTALASTILQGGEGGGETPIETGTQPPATPSTQPPATVQGTGTTIEMGGPNTPESIVVNGTGETGANVSVEIGGATETTTVDGNGNWSVTFTGGNFPVDGKHTAKVTVVDPDGEKNNLTGPSYIIDTTAPSLQTKTVELDDVVNIAEAEDGFVLKGTTLKQNLKASKDQLNRTILRSPMRGVVNNLAVTTIGGVVRPGEEILEIIPLDDDLFVEARVKPKDIANIRSGQSATIKLTAYDYTIYGTLKGYVDVVSADTFKDENSRSVDGDPHYKVRIIVDRDNLTSRQARIEIRPGMQAQAELQTGAKSVLQYLLKPLYKSKDALRER